MRKNEPDATKRIATPVPFYDLDGNLLPNQTFATASGEVFVYKSDTNTFVAATNNASEVGGANTSGIYQYQFTQAEVNKDTLVGVKLHKAGFSDRFWFEKIDNTSDINVVQWLGTAPAAPSVAGIPKVEDATLQARLTALRAGYLDNLNVGGLVAAKSDTDVIAALLNENTLLDGGAGSPNAIYSGNLLISARIRGFASKVAVLAATAGAANNTDGELYRFFITATDGGSGKLGSYLLYRDL